MSRLNISIAAATLAASLGAYAAVPTGAAPFQVVVPNLKSGVEFTLEGLYLQPTNSDLQYATVMTVPAANTNNTSVSSINPDYDFGFRVGLGYVFPDTGNDVQVNWTHFDQDSSDALSLTGASGTALYSTNNVFYRLDGSDDSATANSDANFTYDAVDLDVGQYISVGTRLQTRLFMGLRYAQLKNDITNTYASTLLTIERIPEWTTELDIYNSKFTGIGPRFGVDASYHVGDCFGVVGHVAAALLVGRVESSSSADYTFSSSGGGGNGLVPGNQSYNVTADNQTRVVPAFDAKLGIDYSWPFQNDASRLTIEAGYQVTQYIDAIDRLVPSVDSGVLSGVSTTTSSIGFNGPYLTLNFKL